MSSGAGSPWPRPTRPLLLLGAVLFILWLARAVIGPFVIAAVLAYAFSPLVGAAVARTGWPRLVIVGLGFAGALGLLAAGFAVVAGPLVAELQLLASGGPDSLAVALRQFVGADTIAIGDTRIAVVDLARELQSSLTSLISTPGDAVHLASELADVALNAFLSLIVTFYLLLEGERAPAFALRFLPPAQQARTVEIAARIHAVLGRWLRGQLLLVVLVAAVVYVALGPVLHVPYALAIGIITGILEVIPLVGPLVATALATTVAFAHGGTGLAVTVAIVYLVLRQVEDQLVMPVVIGRAVHLHPVVTIFAVLVGLSTWGVLGGLLGVPVAAALNVILHELYPPADPPQEGQPAGGGPPLAGAGTAPEASDAVTVTGDRAIAEASVSLAEGAARRGAGHSAGSGRDV